MPLNKEEFNRYFLEAQKEGNEVYVGDGAALVVYRKDRNIGIQVLKELAGLPSMVFCSFDLLYTVSPEFVKYLNLVLKPENLSGVQTHLTDIIQKAYYQCALWHEEQDVPGSLLPEQEELSNLHPKIL